VGKNGKDGIEAAVGDVDAAVNHVEVVGIVDAAPGIDDGGFGVVAHAAGASLMLAAADAVTRDTSPGLDGAGFLEPGLRLRGHDSGNFQSMRVLITGELRHWHAPKIPDRGIELHTGIEDRHFLRGSHDFDGAAIGFAHEVLVGFAPTNAIRRHVHGLVRQANEFVGEHGAAAQAGIAVVVIADGDVGARADVVVGVEIEQARSAGIGMALKVAANPVEAIAEAIRKEFAFGIEEEARGFDGSTGDDNEIGGLLLKTVVGVEIGDASDLALLAGEDFFDHAAEPQVAQSGGEGARNDGVVRAALGVHFTNETHAPATAHAGRAAVVGNAVAQHGQIKGMEAEALRRGLEDFVLPRGRERRHGERSGAWALERIVADIPGNADFVFGFFVERRKIFVADGPIVESAAFERAVGGTHAEIFRLVAPGHGAVSECAAADASGVVAVAAFTGENDVPVGVAIHKDARIALVIGARIVAQDGSALVAEIIFAAIVGGVPAAALQKSNTKPRFAEFLGDNAAPGSGSDHDGVHAWQGHGAASAFPGEFVVVAAADGNHGNAEHAPTDGVAIAVVAGITVEALHGVGDDQV